MQNINLKDILIRHPIKYKGKKSLDKKIFKDEILFIQKTDKEKKFLYKTQFIILSVENSLHFKFLLDEKKYINIYENYIKKTKQNEHSIKIFQNLRDGFSLEELSSNKIKLKLLSYGEKKYYIVHDGSHRLSIYLYKYADNLESNYYEIIGEFSYEKLKKTYEN